MGHVTYTNGVLKAYEKSLPRRSDKLAARAGARGEGLVKGNIVAQGAVDTGFMVGSVYHRKVGEGQQELGVGADYAPYVNYGTYKMGARSFWEPAIEQLKSELPAMGAQEFAL